MGRNGSRVKRVKRHKRQIGAQSCAVEIRAGVFLSQNLYCAVYQGIGAVKMGTQHITLLKLLSATEIIFINIA